MEEHAPRRPQLLPRPGPFFALVALLAFCGALAERGVGAWRAQAEPARGAAWIWASGVVREAAPVAFYANRDFRLDTLPSSARLVVAADEEYVAYVNGSRIGAGSFIYDHPVHAAAGARPAAHVYEVADFLKLAGNRLTFELRSSRGAGGLLASLRLDGKPAVVTDGSWRVFRTHDPRLLRGWDVEDAGEPAQVWRRAPNGRWRPAPPREPRPIPGFEFPPRSPAPAALVMVPEIGTWNPLEKFRSRRQFPTLDERVLFDWGEPVTGYLALDLARFDGTPGYVFFGLQPPHQRPSPADSLVLPVPGRNDWVDAHARTFRYAWVVGVALARVPEVLPVSPQDAAALAPPPPARGTFGAEPPRPDTLAEEGVRKRAGGQLAP